MYVCLNKQLNMVDIFIFILTISVSLILKEPMYPKFLPGTDSEE